MTTNEKVVVVIPAYNERFLQRTVDDVLAKATGDIEVVAVLDAYDEDFCAKHDLPYPMRLTQEGNDARVKVIRHEKPTGQRASTNEGARASDAKYFIKADAHVTFDEGFDEKLKADFEPDWTVMPQMYIIDAEEYINQCPICGKRLSPHPDRDIGKFPCTDCKKEYAKEELKVEKNDHYWQPKWHKDMDFMYISNEPGLVHRAQYWHRFRRRPEAKEKLIEVMTGQGAVWFQERQRFLDLGGLDEGHGSWGQVGMEVACKAWLSGGKHVINKNTWFAHWFRGNDPGFPYPLRQSEMNYARDYSRNLWRSGKWEHQIRPLSWLVRKFWPVPTWDEKGVRELEEIANRKAIIYYTDNSLDNQFGCLVRKALRKTTHGRTVINVSQKPLKFGDYKICVGELGRSHLSMYKQILAGAKKAKLMDIPIVCLAEHDCLYPPEHFDYCPEGKGDFYYNQNIWLARTVGKNKDTFGRCNRSTLSGLIARTDPLIKNLKKRIAFLEAGNEIPRGVEGACEPGICEELFMGDGLGKAELFKTEIPILDIRHGGNLTGNRRAAIIEESLPFWGTVNGAIEGVWYK